MKAKEIFKRVEMYNKLANEFGKDETYILFGVEGIRYRIRYHKFKNYREFIKYVESEYPYGLVFDILNNDWNEIDSREYAICGLCTEFTAFEVKYNFTLEICG